MDTNQAVTSGGLWSAISSIAAGASAIAAFLTIRQAVKVRKAELRGRRAFFRIVCSTMNCNEGGVIELPLEVHNVGQHPATDVSFKVLFLSEDSARHPTLSYEFELANVLSNTSVFKFSINPEKALEATTPSQKGIFAMRYRDLILGQPFEQFYFFRWLGYVNGKPSCKITHELISKAAAESFFQEEIGEFKTETIRRFSNAEKCYKCNTSLDGGSKFCNNCGAETPLSRRKIAIASAVMILLILFSSVGIFILLRQ